MRRPDPLGMRALSRAKRAVLGGALAASSLLGCSSGGVCGSETQRTSTIEGPITYGGSAMAYRTPSVIAQSGYVTATWYHDTDDGADDLRIDTGSQNVAAGVTFDLGTLPTKLCDYQQSPACVPLAGKFVVSKFVIDSCSDSPEFCPIHFEADLHATASRGATAIAIDVHLHEDGKRVAAPCPSGH